MAKKRQRSRGQGCVFKRNGSGPWIVRWFDHTGRRREKSSRTTDKATAERILARLIDDTAQRTQGLIDASADRFAAADRKPLESHLADWQTGLIAKGVTKKQVDLVAKRVEVVLAAVTAAKASDVTASAVREAIGELRNNGKSLRTCNHYLRAIKQFSRWLRRDGRIRVDSLVHLTGYNAETELKYQRRPLSPEEITRLVAATENGPALRHMTGVDRAMLYRIAVSTGFRASELRSLTVGSFHLDDDAPFVVLRAANSKRRREDMQPIPNSLVEVLKPWLDKQANDQPVFRTMPEKTAKMIRQDLRRARARWIKETMDSTERRSRRASDFLQYCDASGHVVDFHALRASFITMLVKSGATVKVAQQLARHSDPKLTLNIYTKLGVNDLREGLEALPQFNKREPERQTLRATGTHDDGSSVRIDPHLKPRQLERQTVRTSATRRNPSAAYNTSRRNAKPLPQASLRNSMQSSALGVGKATERTRTVDLRFTKPLLYQLSYGGGHMPDRPQRRPGTALLLRHACTPHGPPL